MRPTNPLMALAALIIVHSSAGAQSQALQNFEQRQLQLDRTLALIGAHAHMLKKRGAAAPPATLEGRILESKKNRDGSVTITTTQGKTATYDPSIYRPIYVQQRDRTLFGLIPDRTLSASGYWTGAPGASGFRTSLSYADLPYGRLPSPDAKGSTTASISQSADWLEDAGVSDSYGLNVSHQINSDRDLLQLLPGVGISADQGATRELFGSLTASHSILSNLTVSATGTYFNGATGSNGWTAQADISVTLTPTLVVYIDGQPPSAVAGTTPWDIGFQATVAPNLSLNCELDQGQVWFVGLTRRFKAR